MKRSAVESDFAAPRDSRSEHIAHLLASRHPLTAAAIVDATGYLVIAALMIGLGVLVVDVLVPAGLGSIDHSVTAWMVDGRTGTLNVLSDVGSRLADTYTAPGLAVVSVLVLVATRHRWEALAVGTAISLEGLLYLTVTLVISRPRPHGVQMESLPPNAAFPSGHTAASVAIYSTLAVVVTALTQRHRVRVVAWSIGIVVPLVVATSRVYRGEHSLSDVLAGLLMGAGCVIFGVMSARVASTVAQVRSATPTGPSPPSSSSPRRSSLAPTASRVEAVR